MVTESWARKLSTVGRLAWSAKSWLTTVPSRDCDILITFPKNTPDHTLMWLLARLRSRTPNLSVLVKHHANTDVYGFYITASYDSLLRGAEDLQIKKPLKEEYGGGLKVFSYDEQEYYFDIEDETKFFTSQERQMIIYDILTNLRALQGESFDKIEFIEGQSIVPVLLSRKVISQVFPLHHNDDLVVLRKSWVQAVFRGQPLDRIREYFGVKLALYFAWLGHYTRALVLPSLLGCLIWYIQRYDNQTVDDLCFIGFALFNTIWATLYLEHWKRRSASLTYTWGTLDQEDELLVEPRSLYKGALRTSPVTGRLEPHYPDWKRNLFRYCITLPVIAIALLTVFATMFAIFELQEFINDLVIKEDLPKPAKFVPKIALAVSIGVLDDIYKKVAHWLNDKENYRLEETYENHLIIKLVLFQFVNSFLSLFYIAFYLRDMDRLRDQLAALLITRQVIGNVKEAFIPFVISKAKLFWAEKKIVEKELKPVKIDQTSTNEKDSSDNAAQKETPKKRVHLSQAEIESAMKDYEGTFEDYLEMFIQFGYVVLFSSAFPLAALCALLNNVIEIRSDAFKLCVNLQRPFGEAASSIGTWQDALELMGVIAVIVNCALIGLSGHIQRFFPGMGALETFLFIVILEHVILFLKFAIAYAIPDIPDYVAEEMAKIEFHRREAVKKMESNPTVFEPVSDKKPSMSGETGLQTNVHRRSMPQTEKDPMVFHGGGGVVTSRASASSTRSRQMSGTRVVDTVMQAEQSSHHSAQYYKKDL